MCAWEAGIYINVPVVARIHARDHVSPHRVLSVTTIATATAICEFTEPNFILAEFLKSWQSHAQSPLLWHVHTGDYSFVKPWSWHNISDYFSYFFHIRCVNEWRMWSRRRKQLFSLSHTVLFHTHRHPATHTSRRQGRSEQADAIRPDKLGRRRADK